MEIDATVTEYLSSPTVFQMRFCFKNDIFRVGMYRSNGFLICLSKTFFQNA
ncbi:hypothetical protein LEP1GSC047_2966 [Leptospira inadai serovar Lyme str. 10]|uniref:Uncharacterized protein n=1 Tax=Leptospira inadai serovar Lyme str. 10 TaxID=1049790 RepID=V6HAE9_9LEPT|nr:hypothetical protein LEP1GSC047_2966 [Leptospira inadai serovar Lyme str. 10]